VTDAADAARVESYGAVLRNDVLIDAPLRTVAGVLRDATVAAEALGRCGHRLTAPARLLVSDDEIRWRRGCCPGCGFQSGCASSTSVQTA
jgi:hypothetical protein